MIIYNVKLIKENYIYRESQLLCLDFVILN